VPNFSETGLHHVALPAERCGVSRKVRYNLRCRCPIGGAADGPLCRDDGDSVVFCFAKPEDAE
jgi:hypothetical protein